MYQKTVLDIYRNFKTKIFDENEKNAKKYEIKMRSNFLKKFHGTVEEFNVAEEKLNKEIQNHITNIYNSSDKKIDKKRKELFQEIRAFLGEPFVSNDEAWNIIYFYASEDGNAYGLESIVAKIEDYYTFYIDIQKNKNKKKE